MCPPRIGEGAAERSDFCQCHPTSGAQRAPITDGMTGDQALGGSSLNLSELGMVSSLDGRRVRSAFAFDNSGTPLSVRRGNHLGSRPNTALRRRMGILDGGLKRRSVPFQPAILNPSPRSTDCVFRIPHHGPIQRSLLHQSAIPEIPAIPTSPVFSWPAWGSSESRAGCSRSFPDAHARLRDCESPDDP